MIPTILFRPDKDTEQEFEICSDILPTVKYRTDIKQGSLVIGRYSVLPFYTELATEILLNGSQLINDPKHHEYIANVVSWAKGALVGLTPKTYTFWGDTLPQGSYVVKGATNSRKHQWKTHMFAKTREDIPSVVSRLLDDTLINQQGIVVREYIPLKKIGEGINELPITNEWRCFFYKDKLLAKGFYWASHPECASSAKWTKEAEIIAQEAAKRVAGNAIFFVVDVAQAQDGHWLIVELNDGQMSGLSTIPPDEFYEALKKEIK